MTSIANPRFAVPPMPPHHVPRPRLLALLDDAASSAVTVVSAGAGAGKSVLLADWARQRHEPVGWLAITPEDDDPTRFWRLLLECARALGREFPPVTWSPGGPVELLDGAFGHGTGSGVPLHVVLDDAHLLTDPQILAGLDRLVERWSGEIRLVLGVRGSPDLPLHRYRLAGRLAEVDASDLTFTEAETVAVLAAHGIELPPDDLGALTARTEGWPAGVRLAALWLQRGERARPSVALMAAATGPVAEYLTREVLTGLPSDVQRVLVATSFLDVVSGALADAVTDGSGSTVVLAQQARVNSMVVPADPGAGTFRYHQLLAEELRRLEEVHPVRERRARRLRAAAWYRDHGDFSRALQCTLAAGDADAVRDLVLRGGLLEAFVGQHELSAPARHAAAAFAAPSPTDLEPLEAADGEGHVARLALTALTADPEQARSAVAALSRDREDAPEPGGAGPGLVLTRHVAELLLARKAGDAELLDRAVAALTSCARLTRDEGSDPPVPGLVAAALLLQARSRFSSGRLHEVPGLLDQAVDEAGREGAAAVLLNAHSISAFVATTAGRREAGADAVREAEVLLASHPDLQRPVTLDLAVARLSELAADWTEMGRALGHLLAAGPLYPDRGVAATVALLQGVHLAASGRLIEAREHLRRAPVLRQEGLGPVRLFRDRELAEIELALGRPDAALALLEAHDAGPLGALAAATTARTQLALGDVPLARRRLDAVAAAPGPDFDVRLRVELQLAEALVYGAEGDDERAELLAREAYDLGGGQIMAPFVRWYSDFAPLLGRRPALQGLWQALASAPATRTVSPPPGNDAVPPVRAEQHLDIVAEIARLAHLHTAGAITDEEFDRRKAGLLGLA